MQAGMHCGYRTQEEFARQLRKIKNIDLMISQNFTSWHGYLAKRIRKDVPLIFDIQDSARTIFGEPELAEDITIKEADGITLLSEFYLDEIPEVKHKKNIVFYSYLPKAHFPEVDRPKVHGIVHEGALNWGEQSQSKWAWRDFRSVCAFLSDSGVPVFLQLPGLEPAAEYFQYGAIPLLPQLSKQMIEQMTAFTWGICGYDRNGKGEVQKDGYLPNKLFEYIASGIPTISYNTKAVGEFVTKHEVGVVANNHQDIVDIFNNRELQQRLEKNVKEKRHLMSMEVQLPQIYSFFNEVIEDVKGKQNE
jgi:glycosyltransferase involved in cell wall biosynthesis